MDLRLLPAQCSAAICRAMALTTLSAGMLFGAAEAKASWSFDQILRKAEKRYGREGVATDRLIAWNRMVESSRRLSEAERVEAVNLYFNQQLRFIDDAALWKQSDYWATPVETMVSGAGDCEDFSLVKYFTLRKLGVPEHKLRITYARELRHNQAHMVLSYFPSAGAEPLILDNLTDNLQPASQRADLLLLYAFDAEGLYKVGKDGLKRAGDTERLPGWQTLMAKMREEGFSLEQG